MGLSVDNKTVVTRTKVLNPPCESYKKQVSDWKLQWRLPGDEVRWILHAQQPCQTSKSRYLNVFIHVGAAHLVGASATMTFSIGPLPSHRLVS